MNHTFTPESLGAIEQAVYWGTMHGIRLSLADQDKIGEAIARGVTQSLDPWAIYNAIKEGMKEGITAYLEDNKPEMSCEITMVNEEIITKYGNRRQ